MSEHGNLKETLSLDFSYEIEDVLINSSRIVPKNKKDEIFSVSFYYVVVVYSGSVIKSSSLKNYVDSYFVQTRVNTLLIDESISENTVFDTTKHENEQRKINAYVLDNIVRDINQKVQYGLTYRIECQIKQNLEDSDELCADEKNKIIEIIS